MYQIIPLCTLNLIWQTFLVVQKLRIHLPIQGTQIQSLLQEDPTCHNAAKPVYHSYCASAPEPVSCNYWGPCAPRAHTLQQEKPPQWEACALQLKSSAPPTPATKERWCKAVKTQHSPKQINFFIKKKDNLHDVLWQFISIKMGQGTRKAEGRGGALLFSCSAQASHCGGFSCCKVWALEAHGPQ